VTSVVCRPKKAFVRESYSESTSLSSIETDESAASRCVRASAPTHAAV